MDEKRDARLVQIVVVGKQRPGDAPRGLVQIVVRESAIGRDDRATRVVIEDKIL